jgi:hypothetical protein
VSRRQEYNIRKTNELDKLKTKNKKKRKIRKNKQKKEKMPQVLGVLSIGVIQNIYISTHPRSLNTLQSNDINQ